MRRRRLALPARVVDTRPVLMAAALFGVGAIGGAHSAIPAWIWLCPGAALLLGGLALPSGRRGKAALLLAAMLFLGAWRVSAALTARPSYESAYDAEIVGVIGDDPVLDAEQGRAFFRLRSAHVNGRRLGFDVRLYLHGGTQALSRLRYGQAVRLTGHLLAPEPATNPGQFDFGLYLWRNGLGGYASGQLADAELSAAGFSLPGAFYELRRGVSARIERLFPHSAQLVKALVLGERRDLDAELRDSFARAGVAHLLAISGMHVTLLALGLSLLLGRLLPKRITFFITLLALCFYGALAGFSASIVRAILMYAALGSAPVAGRMADAFTRVGLVFLLMLAAKPLYILDSGFALSFSAVAGLLCLTPPLERCFAPLLTALRPRSRRKLAKLPQRLVRGVVSALCATLAAQLGTLPCVIAAYGTLPLLGTLTNLVAVPLAMAALALALLALLLSCVVPPLAALLALVPDLLFRLLVGVTAVGAALPFAAFRLSRFSGWLGALYALLAALASGLSRLRNWQRLVCVLLLPALAAVAIGAARLDAAGLSVLFLDVGQGDCALVTAQGRHYLMDAGPWGSYGADYIEREGIHLSGIFLSHPHADHAGGLARILIADAPDAIYLPAGWFDVEADSGLFETLELAQDMGVELIELEAGDALPLSPDVVAEVLHPAADFEPASTNSVSMVVRVRYGAGSALFTGDLPAADEPLSLPDADVLKVPHHGAANSTSIWLAAATSPSVAVIQVGRGNGYGHPTAAALERLERTGARIYRNDLNGAVRVRIFPNGYVRVQPFIP